MVTVGDVFAPKGGAPHLPTSLKSSSSSFAAGNPVNDPRPPPLPPRPGHNAPRPQALYQRMRALKTSKETAPTSQPGASASQSQANSSKSGKSDAGESRTFESKLSMTHMLKKESGEFSSRSSDLPSIYESDDDNNSVEGSEPELAVHGDEQDAFDAKPHFPEEETLAPYLHPLHTKEELRNGGSALCQAKPVKFPGCCTAEQLAKHVAELRIERTEKAGVALGGGMLMGNSEYSMVAIPLIHARVAYAEVKIAASSSSMIPWQRTPVHSQARLVVIAIVAIKDEELANGQHAFDPSKEGQEEVSGWCLLCPQQSLQHVLCMLSRSGCVRADLMSILATDNGESVGSGAFGAVTVGKLKQECLDFVLSGEDVAVKEMKPKIKMDSVRREVALLASAQGHRCVVGYVGAFLHTKSNQEQVWAIVMEGHTSGDLFQLVCANGTFKEPLALHFLQDTMRALEHLKKLSIVHRDVKPENVLISDELRGVLGDFGIACFTWETVEMMKRKGSVGYIPPETYFQQPKECAGDIFSAGVLLHFMLYGSTPFQSTSLATMTSKTIECKIDWGSKKYAGLSTGLKELFPKLICQNPQDRLTPQAVLAHPCMAAARAVRAHST